MPRYPAPAAAPAQYVWIVDGHNLLFSFPHWARLHAGGRGRDARAALEAWLEAFGLAAGVQPWLVYDGVDRAASGPLGDHAHLRVRYSTPPAEADDEIRQLAIGALRAGRAVCVVSSDRRTLAASLPPEVRRVSVRAFRRLHRELVRSPEKWMPTEQLTDVERHFLESSPFASDREAAGREEGEEPPPPPADREDPR